VVAQRSADPGSLLQRGKDHPDATGKLLIHARVKQLGRLKQSKKRKFIQGVKHGARRISTCCGGVVRHGLDVNFAFSAHTNASKEPLIRVLWIDKEPIEASEVAVTLACTSALATDFSKGHGENACHF
jgi:hypothetical protein